MGSSSKMATQPPPYGASAPPPQQGYAPPPQQGYAPPPQQPVTVQVQHAPAQLVQGQIRFDKHPIAMTCPHCQQSITTTTSTSVGGFAWVAGGVLCLFGCWPCACIPCCVDDCLDFNHNCPSCNRVLGTYRRL